MMKPNLKILGVRYHAAFEKAQKKKQRYCQLGHDSNNRPERDSEAIGERSPVQPNSFDRLKSLCPPRRVTSRRNACLRTSFSVTQ